MLTIELKGGPHDGALLALPERQWVIEVPTVSMRDGMEYGCLYEGTMCKSRASGHVIYLYKAK